MGPDEQDDMDKICKRVKELAVLEARSRQLEKDLLEIRERINRTFIAAFFPLGDLDER